MTPLFIKGRPTCQRCNRPSIACQCAEPQFPDVAEPWLDEVLAMPEELDDIGFYNTEGWLQQKELKLEREGE